VHATSAADFGEYDISVTISDTLDTTTSSFTVKIMNLPPYFIDEVPKDFTMNFNTTYKYLLPSFKDDENDPITIILESDPPGTTEFASINTNG